MLRPVCLLIFTLFPNCPHQHLLGLLYLSISLGVIGQNSCLLNAHELTQLTYDVAFKVGSSVTQELGWGSEDQDISLPQKSSNSFCSLIWSHICHDMPHKVVTKDQNIHYVWSSSIVISMLVKSTWSSSKEEVTRIASRGAFAWAPSCWIHFSQLLIAFCICIAMPGHQNWSCNRDSVCHWPWCPASLWHPFTATTLWAMGTTNCMASSSSQAGYGSDRGHPDGVWISSVS